MEKPYIPNPANYVMKGAETAPAQSLPAGVPQFDAKTLRGMSKGELIDLLRVCHAALGGTITLSDEDTARAMRIRLAHVALTASVKDALQAINAWLDRHEGKPTQKIESKQLVVTAQLEEQRAESINKANEVLAIVGLPAITTTAR